MGRVQTPTLAMLVERELAIRNFVPGRLSGSGGRRSVPQRNPAAESYKGTWFRDAEDDPQIDRGSLPMATRPRQIVARARTGKAAIESVKAETQRMPPPLLYDLTELQRHANRLFGFSAQKTLDLAQALYERHKLISYPRTDSRHLSQDVAVTLPGIVADHRRTLSRASRAGNGRASAGPPICRRYESPRSPRHHPHSDQPRSNAAFLPDERKIYDLICRRLLTAWHDDHIWSVTTVITAIANGEIIDRYHSSGTAVQQVGWKVLDPQPTRRRQARRRSRPCRRGSHDGQAQDVLNVESVQKKTRAPKRLTEATLLTAMETAGKTLDEKELSDAMKETGLGTPATRAAIIETLLKRGVHRAHRKESGSHRQRHSPD